MPPSPATTGVVRRDVSLRELAELRDRTGVFRDRGHAGEVLAGMLRGVRQRNPILLAIPAGGVPVAVAIADTLGLELDVVVVSKITPPWNTEIGYGAVAFDGTVRLNRPLIRRLGLDDREVREGIEHTREKVARRAARLRGGGSVPDLTDRSVVLVDDGLASGFTMRTAVDAVAAAGAADPVIAVPTGSSRAVADLDRDVSELYCANVRTGRSFAVADAYIRWTDVDESEAIELVARRWRRDGGSAPRGA